MKRFLLIFLAFSFVIALTACGKAGTSGDITTTDMTNPYKFDMNGTQNPNLDAEKIIVPINDTSKFDKDTFAKRVCELRELDADNFTDASKLSINKIVYYSFCHMYYKTIYDIPKTSALREWQSAIDTMNSEIKKNFLIGSFDATKSDNYQTSKKIFDMWQPNARTAPIYNAEVKQISTDKYELTVTFFDKNDTAKSTPLTKSVATIVKSDGNYVFASLVSSAV